MLAISERQLRSWEKLSLIPPQETFAFSDLIALRTLARLRQSRVPLVQIRRAVAALCEKLSSVSDPLRELKIFTDGRKVTVQVAGNRMDPISGQLLLDFDQAEIHKMLSFPKKSDGKESRAARQYESVLCFDRALELEQTGAPIEDIIQAYEEVIRLDPKSPGALVNLGTIYYHLRKWKEAEQYYRRSVEADPSYALAHFNLSNGKCRIQLHARRHRIRCGS